MTNKLWNKNYILSILCLILVHMGPYLLISVISIFGMNLTQSNTYAGMLASVFAVTGLFSRFISAYYMNKKPLKNLLFISILILCLSSFGYIFVNEYWLAFLLRAIQGLGYGLAVTIMSTYIIHIIPSSTRLEGIGYAALTNSLGSVVGPTLAYIILGAQLNQFKLLFIVVFMVSFLALLPLLPLQNVKPIKKEDNQQSETKLPWIQIIIGLFIYFFSNLAYSAITTFLSLYAISKNIDGIGYFFSIVAVGIILSRFTMAKIVNLIHEKALLLIVTCIQTLCTLLLPFMNNQYQLYILAIALGYSIGNIIPLINTHIIHLMSETKSGLANALFYAAGDVSFIFGSIFWGLISSLLGYSTMFIVAGIVCVLSVISSLLIKKQIN